MTDCQRLFDKMTFLNQVNFILSISAFRFIILRPPSQYCFITTFCLIFAGQFHKKSKSGCKDQESIQSSTTPDPGYQWESDKLTVDTTNESQEVPFSAGDHKAYINRRAQRHSKHKTEQKHKRSTKEVPPWNGQ